MARRRSSTAAQRLAAEVAASQRATWFDKLPAANRKEVEDLLDAIPTTPRANVNMVYRMLKAGGVLHCSSSTFKEFARARANGS